MARCLIIAPLYAGEEQQLIARQAGDMIICADGGYAAARQFGIEPDLTIGDFDSMPDVPVEGDIIRLPVHKDDTDLAACIKEGRKRGYREFVAVGCLGGRFDHTLSALQCAADCAARGESLWLCDRQNRVTVLSPGSYEFPAVPGRKISLLSYTPRVGGVCASGTMWTLDSAELTNNYPLGCSNEWTSEVARVSFESGQLVVCFSGDQT